MVWIDSKWLNQTADASREEEEDDEADEEDDEEDVGAEKKNEIKKGFLVLPILHLNLSSLSLKVLNFKCL